jgi:hypothetical protein
VATGSQWHHEYLYYTKSGRWVLNCFSNYQGTLETYEQIDEADAVAWLIRNEHFDSEQLQNLPTKIRDAVQQGVAAAEI